MTTLARQTPRGRNPAVLYLARQAPTGRHAQTSALEQLARILTKDASGWREFDWAGLRYPHMAAIRKVVVERFAPNTANRYLSAVRGVLKEAWRLGLIDVEEYHRARDIERIRGSRLPVGREVTKGELAQLLDDNRKGPGAARDLALVALLYGAGLRRSEACRLHMESYEAKRGRLRVLGKRNKEETVYLKGKTREALEAWLHVRGNRPGPLFVPVTKVGTLLFRPMSEKAVQKVLVRMQKRAGVESFTPHDLRRSVITHLLDDGVDLAAVQKFARHDDPDTTTKYDRRGDAAKEKAAEAVRLPWRGA